MSDLRGAFGGAEAARVAPRFEHKVGLGRLTIAALTSRAVFVVAAAIVGGSLQLVEILGESVLDEAGRTAARLGVVAVAVLAVLGIVATLAISVIVTVARDFGFTARRVDDRVETEAGLLERRMTGMPIRRIQAVSVDEAPLRRLFGWASIQAITAGFGEGEDQKSTTAAALVPIARRNEVAGLLHALLPEAERFPDLGPLPRRAVRFYVLLPTLAAVAISLALAAAATVLGALAAIAAGAAGVVLVLIVIGWNVLAWRHAAFGTDERALGIAQGVLGRRHVRIGRSRIQSLSVRQNPFQRRARLATVVATGVSGSSKQHYRVRHVEREDAERLIEWYSRRSDASTNLTEVAQ
jgi:putative membrane protein